VFVPGVTGDHTHLAFVAPLLEPHFSLWMMDRRGRGESGDAPEYTIEREYEDVAAVVDAIGGPMDVFGHSFGGDVVLGAMLLTANLRRAVIYEPGPGDLPNLDAAADELEALCAREAMLEKFSRELVGFTAERYAEHRASDASRLKCCSPTRSRARSAPSRTHGRSTLTPAPRLTRPHSC
jgi:pimeloyl-ACP methyl ester carboxylesterase